LKLLFDQNISFRLLKSVKDIFPGSVHVKDVGLVNSSDLQIWQFARRHNYVIVTFDADFYDLSLIRGAPPRVIWIRAGNTTTGNLTRLLIRERLSILEFLTGSDQRFLHCLEIYDTDLP